jgi:hypothetical protein
VEAAWSVLGALRKPSLYASDLRGPVRRTISSMSQRRKLLMERRSAPFGP